MSLNLKHLTGLYFILTLFITACGNGNLPKEEVEQLKEKEVVNKKKKIIFFGNSLTAGFGLPIEQSFPYLVQKRIDSLNLNYKVVNAGISGETTATGLNRVKWVTQSGVDVFILELGANDGLRGIPVSETEGNLMAIVDSVRSINEKVEIILAGMKIPPNMGADYGEEFEAIYPRVAEAKQIKLIPFLLENVAGIRELNQDDGLHPTAEGLEIVAETVWGHLEEVL